jgi:hypothetical protein
MNVSDAQAYRAEGAEQREAARLLAHARASSISASQREDQVRHAVVTAVAIPTVAEQKHLVDVTV